MSEPKPSSNSGLSSWDFLLVFAIFASMPSQCHLDRQHEELIKEIRKLQKP